MNGMGTEGNNIGHYNRMLYTADNKVAVLEGPIRMDICHQERLIVNGVGVKIKFTQMDDAFRLAANGYKQYELEIADAILKVCQVKLKPQVLVTQNDLLSSKNALYPLWQSDIKTYNVQAGDYKWKKGGHIPWCCT